MTGVSVEISDFLGLDQRGNSSGSGGVPSRSRRGEGILQVAGGAPWRP